MSSAATAAKQIPSKSMSDPGSGIGGSGREIQKGRKPPDDPEFYLEWGKEETKAFLANATTALGQLLTLSTALLGGTIAFWNYIPIALGYRFVVVAAALTTVLICLFSTMPRSGGFDPNSASDIRSYMEHTLADKKRRLRNAKWSLIATLLIMIAALAVTAWENRDEKPAAGASTSTGIHPSPNP
jgi:hypothetical protein